MKTDELLTSETQINKLQTDFRVEAVAANILNYHNSNSSIFIKRVGINDRAYLKDIKEISTSYHDLDEDAIIIETYREGIYDYLPEGIFHPPSLGTSIKNVESTVKEIRKQKKIEDNARNFFQPFEQEFFYTQITALLKEAEFDTHSKTQALLEFAREIWPILEKIDDKTAQILLHTLPFLHEVRGKKNWIEQFLTSFLNAPVNISFVPNIIDQKDDKENITALGQARLGITLIPSGKHMDGERNWKISIGPIPYEEVPKYVHGHKFRDLLHEIYDYFVPITVKIHENFITEKEEKSFTLQAENNTNRLGYSTFL